MKTKNISIVIPVYNEEESLPELYEKLIETLSREYDVEYIFIDDGSTDKSFEVLQKIKKNSSEKITIIQLRKRCGKSAALAVGFNIVKRDVIVTLDADLQDQPSNIPSMIHKIDDGFDMVVGWRKKRYDPSHKLLLSKCFNAIVSKVSGIPIHDFNIGLKCYNREVIAELRLYGEFHRLIPVLVKARGFSITEIPVIHAPRKYGKSKFGFGRMAHGALDLMTTLFLLSFKYQPMKLFGSLGAFFIFLGIIIMTYLSILHFQGETIGRRPLLFLGMLQFIFGVQLFVGGLLAELITHYAEHTKEYPVKRIIT